MDPTKADSGEEVASLADTPTPAPHQRDLERKAKELEALFEVSKILSSAPDLSTLMNSVVERLVAVLEAAESAAVLLYSPETDCLQVFAAHGFQGDWLRKAQLRRGESISGRVFESGQALLFRSAEEVAVAMANMRPENLRLWEKAVGGSGLPRSAIAAPLNFRGTRIGVLVLENLREGSTFVQSDQGFVQALADLLAMAVERE